MAHLLPWTIILQPPLVAIPNWWWKRCIEKVPWNWRLNVRLVKQYIVFPIAIGHTSPKGLGIANRGDVPKTHVIRWGIWFWLMWKHNWNNYNKPFAKFSRWRQSWKWLKTMLEGPLPNKWFNGTLINSKESLSSCSKWKSSRNKRKSMCT